MNVSRETRDVPKFTKKKLTLIIALFFSIVMLLPAGLYAFLNNDIEIKAEGETIEVSTFGQTVEEVLAEEGISYRAEDKIMPGLSAEVEDKMIIEIVRAFPAKIMVEGEKVDLYTTETTVEGLLKSAEIDIDPLDKVEPSLKSTVTPGTDIKVVRVTEELETEEITVEYKTERNPDSSMTEGERKVSQQGEEGVAEKAIKVTYEDGEEVSREVVEEKVIKEPVEHVIAYGTKPKVRTVSRAGQNLSYTESKTMQATAYTHTGNNTATGTKPSVGTIAVDTSVIPFGTRLYVEGYGFGVAEDTGGAINGNIIDVFMDTRSEAINWGRRNVTVYILK